MAREAYPRRRQRLAGPGSVPEVAAAGEDHRRARSTHGRDHLVVALRAARLDHRPTPASSASSGPSANGKNASDASTAPRVVAVLARLLDRDPDRVDTAHLTGADPERLPSAASTIAFERDVLGDAPREEQVGPPRLVDRAADDLIVSRVVDVVSRSWTSSPPSTRL